MLSEGWQTLWPVVARCEPNATQRRLTRRVAPGVLTPGLPQNRA
jgi:hypothetical protein